MKKGLSRKAFLAGTGALALAGAGGFGGYRYWSRGSAYPVSGLADIADDYAFDVCVIGSGPAGVCLGLDLVAAGFRTLVVESGRTVSDLMSDARYLDLEYYGNSGSIFYPTQTTRVRALGGTSNIWTGRCSRLHPIDFEINAYTPEGSAWPIDYAELEPYYARAEQTLRVRGGELSTFQAPRSGPLPLAPERGIDGLRAYMESLGVTVDDSPTSASRENPDQPVRVADDLLPDFARHPLGTLLAGSTVTRLEMDDSGRVTGAVAQDLDRRTRRLRAGIFVIACGAIESARLLLLSTSAGFPAGLGNNTDLVGKYFGEHPNLSFRGRIQQPPASLSRQAEMGRCHQYYASLKREGFGSAILKFAHGRIKDDQALNFRVGATMEMQPVASNRISLDPSERDYFDQPVANVALSFSRADESTLDAIRALTNELYASMGATDVQEIEQSWSHHHIGTCRMGATPQAGVVDGDLLLHGSENLFVLGSAVFVTGGASHPTLTIVALAHRLAESIARRVSPAATEEAGAVS